MALDPAKAGLRRWLDGEVGNVAEDRLQHVLGQLRGEKCCGAIGELVTVSLLRDVAGLDVTSDPLLDGLTPDLIASDRATGTPLFIGEVRSRSIAADVVAEQREWLALAQAVATITSPALLRVTIRDRRRFGAPIHAEREAVVQHMRKYLTPRGLAPGWSTSLDGHVRPVPNPELAT